MNHSSPTSLLQVDFEPIGRRVSVHPGDTLLEAAQKAGVELISSCGGAGFCGTCLIHVIQGQVNGLTATEIDMLEAHQIAAGLRLACQTTVLSDVKVHVPPESLATSQQLQVEGEDISTVIDPAVTITDLALLSPRAHNLRTDLARVDAALAEQKLPALHAAPDQLVQLSTYLQSSRWRARLVTRTLQNDSEFIAVLPGSAAVLGLAIDIGSTKIAFYLVDLETGGTLATSGIMNPQIAFGEDVVSRIAYASRGEAQRRQLQTVLVDAINATTASLCTHVEAAPNQICDCVVVGNTVIHHLFCGLPVAQLGTAPYQPAVKDSLNIPAVELGLAFAAGAQIYLPSIIAGYIGADHVVALIAALPLQNEKTNILIDIGTNTEISLLHRGKYFSCSCASGPAFEGAHIRDGMRAVPGAIERVQIGPDGRVIVHTIGGQPPIGMCGSGILSAVSELRRIGIVDARGTLHWNGQKEFILVPAQYSGHGRDILVTRKDVHEIQLAKGAIRAGIEVLLHRAGIAADGVDEWIIAGAFGTHIDLGAAMGVGMFPAQPLDHFHQVGNAAGMGAKQMLISRHKREQADSILPEIQYIELTTEPDFQNTYVKALSFPE